MVKKINFKSDLKNKPMLGILLFALLFTSCDNTTARKPSRFAGGGDKGEQSDKDKDNIDPKPNPISCDNQWLAYVKQSPLGRETVYQETHLMGDKKEQSILSQNVVKIKILENTEDKISWSKNTKLILPEKGSSDSELSMNKKDFLDLCGKGVKFKLGERPFGMKPISTKADVIELSDQKYEVSYEIYKYKRGSGKLDTEEFEVWIGSKDSYDGVLFKSIRHYYSNETGSYLEHAIIKELGSLTTKGAYY